MKIRIKGRIYFLQCDSLDESGPIELPEHCDADGTVRLAKMFAVIFGDRSAMSYAHWFAEEGVVMRWNKQIATRKDIDVVGV